MLTLSFVFESAWTLNKRNVEFFSSYEFDFLVEDLCSICIAVCEQGIDAPRIVLGVASPHLFMSRVSPRADLENINS